MKFDTEQKAINAICDALVAEAKHRRIPIVDNRKRKTMPRPSGQLVLGGAEVSVSPSYSGRSPTIVVRGSGYGSGVAARSFPWRLRDVDKAIEKAPRIVQALHEVSQDIAKIEADKQAEEDGITSRAQQIVRALNAAKIPAHVSSGLTGGYGRTRKHADIYLGSRDEDTTPSGYHGIGLTVDDATVKLTFRLTKYVTADTVVPTVQKLKAALDSIEPEETD